MALLAPESKRSAVSRTCVSAEELLRRRLGDLPLVSRHSPTVRRPSARRRSALDQVGRLNDVSSAVPEEETRQVLILCNVALRTAADRFVRKKSENIKR